MKRKTEISELVFRILSYTFLTVFALCCLYPFVYAVAASLSSKEALDYNKVVIVPIGLNFGSFAEIFNNNMFWSSYTNTLFLTFYGTVWSLGVSILGGYALSKKRLLFRKGFNFFLVFTMWFSAGVYAQKKNYEATRVVFNSFGITDVKWLIVISMGMAAMNIILLRNAFENVPSEIEEAARVDGASEMQILTKVYLPMCRSTVATVALFFAISRWNGYFWSMMVLQHDDMEVSEPLQVFIRNKLREFNDNNRQADQSDAVIYSLVVCAIIPILVIYPFIQKYFAKGVNMGGVKE